MNQAFDQILEIEFEKGQAKEEEEIKEILRLLIKGKSNTSIAQTLNIDEAKVEEFRKILEPIN